MGDPRKARRTFTRPKKRWDKSRLEAQAVITKDYGVVNKVEIYKMESLLRKFASRAKGLIAANTAQSEKEKKALLSKLSSMALISENAPLDDVLALELKNIMERRLQTLLVRKGLASTVKQARQFITHQHIKVGKKVITSPSYLVSKEEEATIAYSEKSPLANASHPERPEVIFKAKEDARKTKKIEGPADIKMKDDIKQIESKAVEAEDSKKMEAEMETQK